MSAGTEFGQQHSSIRFDWGATGADAVTVGADVAVVVDVLSFTTTLSVAMDAGIDVIPCRWRGETALELAGRYDAAVAVGRSDAQGSEISLSPSTIRALREPPARLVLPSPNGSTIAEHLRECVGVCIGASLRNAHAVADWIADRHPGSVIGAATVRLQPLRPAVEDLWGAGAVIARLLDASSAGASSEARVAASASSEARVAAAVWNTIGVEIGDELRSCVSGRELIEAGYPGDVVIASEVNSSASVPVLRGPFFVDARALGPSE